MRSFEIGERVYNPHNDETGSVLHVFDFGIKVQVDVKPEGWERSVIGPPSGITAVWERWHCWRGERADYECEHGDVGLGATECPDCGAVIE